MMIGRKDMHLTDTDFMAWEQGSLSPDEAEWLLTHTTQCPYCADAWMVFMERNSDCLIPPPAYLADEITERVHQPDAVVMQKVYTGSKRMQLFCYSLKVGAALAASIYMLFALDGRLVTYLTQLWGNIQL